MTRQSLLVWAFCAGQTRALSMLLRNVAGLDGGVRKNCLAVLAHIFLGSTAEGALDVANECGKEWNVLSDLHMCPPNRRGWKCIDTIITGI